MISEKYKSPMSNYYTELVKKSKKTLIKANKLFEENEDAWLNAKEISEMMGYCRYWVYKKMENNIIKSKIDKSKGRGNKIYRIVHIKWLINFLKEVINKKSDLFQES